MAEIIARDKRDGYIYDPVVKGYDTTFWKSVVGTPAMSTVYIRYNQAESASYLQHIFADVEFNVKVPAAPTTGDARSFGFKNPATTSYGAAYFDIAGAVFTAKVVTDGGTVVTKTLSWIEDYTDTSTNFRIRWEAEEVMFYIGGVLVATVSASPQGLPVNALAIDIKNGNADNMDVAWIEVRRAASII